MDSATHPQTKKLFSSDKLTAAGIPVASRLYVGGPDELEELFTDEVWCKTANLHWPRNDGRAWVKEHISEIRVTGKFSSLACGLFKRESDEGPMGKPQMLLTLVSTLKSKDDVPMQLREKFGILIASLESSL